MCMCVSALYMRGGGRSVYKYAMSNKVGECESGHSIISVPFT